MEYWAAGPKRFIEGKCPYLANSIILNSVICSVTRDAAISRVSLKCDQRSQRNEVMMIGNR
jgi:hypothetical protein